MEFLKSAFVVGFFTLISRILGFARDILIAKYFGSNIFSDAFFTAFRLPNFFRKIFAEGAFNSAFVPIFSSELATKKKQEIYLFARNIFSFLLYTLLIFIIFAEIFMPFFIRIIAPGFISNIEKFNLTVALAKITFPYLLFISLVSMMSGILNSFNKFAIVSSCPIILNATFLVSIFLATQLKIELAFMLSWAVFIAGILQFFWLFVFTLKHGVLLYPTFPKLDKITRKFFRKFFHGVIGSGIIQINTVIDSIIATIIPNAVTYLYYANRISQFPLALIGTALGTGVLPVLSKNIELQNHKESSNIQEKALFIALFLGIPASTGLFYFSNLIISTFFERGKFIASDTIAVANALKLYSIGLPAFISIKILQTIFFAKKDTKTPMITSSICMLLNLLLNLLFIKPFGYLGIVLATIISSFTNLFLLKHLLSKNNIFKFSKLLHLQILKIIYCTIIMLLFVIFMNNLFLRFIKEISFISKLSRLGVVVICGIVLYFLIAHLIKLINVQDILKLFKKAKLEKLKK